MYVASSLSLAALEMRVPLQKPDLLLHYAVRSVSFDESLVMRIAPQNLPSNWRDDAPPASVRQIGDDWVMRRESVVLAVPSAVIQLESNYLINPAHPDFSKLRIGPEQPFLFDPRLTSH